MGINLDTEGEACGIQIHMIKAAWLVLPSTRWDHIFTPGHAPGKDANLDTSLYQIELFIS